MSPTPHGCGPMPVAMLCFNTLVLAEAKIRNDDIIVRNNFLHSTVNNNSINSINNSNNMNNNKENNRNLSLEIPSSWTEKYCTITKTPLIVKEFHFLNFNIAVDFINNIKKISNIYNHHPTITINNQRLCHDVHGCVIDIELNTYSLKTITDLDVNMANEIEKNYIENF